MNIKFIVNTVEKYSETTLPVIIESLNRNNIYGEDIFVIEGGHRDRTLEKTKEYIKIKVDHNSFDLTAFIEIAEHGIDSNYIFYLHDTVILGNNFNNLLEQKIKSLDEIPAVIPLYNNGFNGGSMNMGIYSTAYIMSKKDVLYPFKNTNYSQEGLKNAKRENVIHEDILSLKAGFIFSLCPRENRYVYPDEKIIDAIKKSEQINEMNEDIYKFYSGDERERRLVEYYSDLDLFKIKANYGQNTTGEAGKMVISL